MNEAKVEDDDDDDENQVKKKERINAKSYFVVVENFKSTEFSFKWRTNFLMGRKSFSTNVYRVNICVMPGQF